MGTIFQMLRLTYISAFGEHYIRVDLMVLNSKNKEWIRRGFAELDIETRDNYGRTWRGLIECLLLTKKKICKIPTSKTASSDKRASNP